MGLLELWGRMRWATRRFRLDIPPGALVLDLGSGGDSFPRADILVDKTIDSLHRLGASLIIDRPSCLADGYQLPFRDKAFDYVILSHTLEHISDPGPFLKEIERVGKAGYIETLSSTFSTSGKTASTMSLKIPTWMCHGLRKPRHQRQALRRIGLRR